MSMLFTLWLSAISMFASDSSVDVQKFTTSIQVNAVEIVVDVRDASGVTPPDLKAEDFEIREDGSSQPVIGLEYLGQDVKQEATPGEAARLEATPARAWRFVLYFDHRISSTPTIREAARQLAAEANAMTALGSVEIVSADPSPKSLLAASRDSEAVRAVLTKMSNRGVGRSEFLAQRFEFLTRFEDWASADAQHLGSAKQLDQRTDSLIRVSVQEERRLIADVQNHLVNWTGRYLGDEPKTLILVSDGYDVNPVEFYGEYYLTDRERQEMVMELHGDTSFRSNADVADFLAGRGWTVIALAPGYMNAQFVGAAIGGASKMSSFLQGERPGQNTSVVTTHALDPLFRYQQATGGELLTDVKQAGSAIRRLGERIRLTYQVSRLSDDRQHKVHVTVKRPGLKVLAPELTAGAASELLTSSRAAALATGETMQGDLSVKCTTTPVKVVRGGQETSVVALIDFTPLAALRDKLTKTSLRVAIAVERGKDEPPFLLTSIVTDVDLRKEPVQRYEFPLRFTEGTRRASIVVEELATGAWGGATIPLQ